MTQGNATVAAYLLLGLPLLGSLLTGLLGGRLGRRFVNLTGTASIFAAFVVAVVAFIEVLSGPHGATTTLWTWLNLNPNHGNSTSAGNLSVGVDVTIDQLSILMLLVITGVGFLIHLYSVGYMAHDPGVARFFSYMNFFIFSMETLVLGANLIVLIMGWALVALSSYLLIGFWYERPSAVDAARKAFITQVIGDVGLVLAAFLIVINLRDGSGNHLFTLNLPTIFAHADTLGTGSGLINGICILLAIGAFAKSAQFPLHTWLPDAMEGPTPVSALIHAATMVTAGVYLIARFHPLFDRAPVAQGIVACVGIGTALMAGIIALSQIDIKRVIAYSTMSQIGLMIYAVGIGAYSAGMYHFLTHAFFKALLFMAAGNVIHALEDPASGFDAQDIRNMGGLAARMRTTELAFLSGTIALAGIVPFAGFWSKEGLLGYGLTNGPGAVPWLLYIVGISINVLTGLYAFRLWARVFRGEPETARVYAAHEAPPVMLVPVVILAVLSAITGVIFWIGAMITGHEWLSGFIGSFLDPLFTSPQSGHVAEVPGLGLAILGLVAGLACSLAGAGMAMRLWYEKRWDPAAWAHRTGVLAVLSHNKFYFDEIYDGLFVRPIRSLGRGMRRVVEPRVMDGWVRGVADAVGDVGLVARISQTGLIRDYASYMIVAAAILVIVVIVHPV